MDLQAFFYTLGKHEISKFISRFRYIEMKAAEQKKCLSDMTLKGMDAFWDEAKGKGKKVERCKKVKCY